jgi:hypothetical protein
VACPAGSSTYAGPMTGSSQQCERTEQETEMQKKNRPSSRISSPFHFLMGTNSGSPDCDTQYHNSKNCIPPRSAMYAGLTSIPTIFSTPLSRLPDIGSLEKAPPDAPPARSRHGHHCQSMHVGSGCFGGGRRRRSSPNLSLLHLCN